MEMILMDENKDVKNDGLLIKTGSENIDLVGLEKEYLNSTNKIFNKTKNAINRQDEFQENCRIVTAKDNSRNRRSNKYVEINGELMLLCEAIERFSVVTEKQFELRYYHQKWPLEKALFQPLQVHHKKLKGMS